RNGGQTPLCRPRETPQPREGSSFASLFLLKASIYRLDEHVCCPGTRCRTVASIEVDRGTSRFHLRERHAFVDGVLHAVSNHHDHIPVGGHVGGIGQPSVA